MLWQDAVLSFGGFFVAVTMVPMLRAPVKPPLATSSPLVGMLIAISFTLCTLGLWLAAAGSALQCTLWLVLAVMRWRTTRAAGASTAPMPLVLPARPPPAARERAA